MVTEFDEPAADVTLRIEDVNSESTNVKCRPDVEDTDIFDTVTEMAKAQVLGISERHDCGLQEARNLVQVQDPGHPAAQAQDLGHQAVQGHDPGHQTAEVADEPPAVLCQHQPVTEDLADLDDDQVETIPRMSLKTWFLILMNMMLMTMAGQGFLAVMGANMMGGCPTGGQANNIVRYDDFDTGGMCAKPSESGGEGLSPPFPG